MISVLLVESHAELRSVIASALDRAKYRCDAVASSADAVLKLRRGDYAYILVDIDSPEPMPGLYDALTNDPRLLSRVVVITDGEAKNVMSGRPELVKPFDTAQLLAPLRR